jgi:DNA-binding NarL/FixJ family response regulator
MSEQRIILANGSRLLRDMLKRVLFKSEHFEVVREVTDQKELPSAIERTQPEWVILSLSYDNGVPAWVDAFMANHPSVRFMAVAADGSKVKMKWLEIHEQELNGLSLNELIHILESKPASS